jgi:hypothetical protein
MAELLLQGLLLHEYSCPTPWIFAPTNFNRVPPPAPLVKRMNLPDRERSGAGLLVDAQLSL